MTTRARELAKAFDRSFAEPMQAVQMEGSNALAIRVAEVRYVVRLTEVDVIARSPKIVPLPNGSAMQLGIAGIRGSLVTVFSLAALLGHERRAHGWIVRLSTMRDLAIAFDELEGQIILAPEDAPPNLLELATLLERGGA